MEYGYSKITEIITRKTSTYVKTECFPLKWSSQPRIQVMPNIII